MSIPSSRDPPTQEYYIIVNVPLISLTHDNKALLWTPAPEAVGQIGSKYSMDFGNGFFLDKIMSTNRCRA